jgi:hypothetical protein
MEVETIFAIASTVALVLALTLAACFLSPRFGGWMARHAGRISPRLGRLFRDGL